MKRLSQSEENRIRSWLDEIEARLYHSTSMEEDLYEAHKIIKGLLLDIHILQRDKQEREDKSS
jgi:hypothetical protein